MIVLFRIRCPETRLAATALAAVLTAVLAAPLAVAAPSARAEAPRALAPVATQPAAQPPLDAAAGPLAVWVDDSPYVNGLSDRVALELRRFYAARGGQAWWTDADGLTERGRDLLEALARSAEHGIDPTQLAVASLAALSIDADTPEVAARLDVALSTTLLTYATWLLGEESGPAAIRHPVFELRSDRMSGTDLALLLERGTVAQAIHALAPGHEQYRRLQAALVHHRKEAAHAAAPVVVPGTETLRIGDHGPRVEALRRRLVAAGDLKEGGRPSRAFDEAVRSAVKAFQKRNQLEPDGVVGRSTLAAMNLSPADRVAKVEAALEQWRRMPRDLGRRHVLVNVPAYRFALIEDGRETMTMNVVVGTKARQTPSFSSLINAVQFNPTWSVPQRLAVEDIVPAIRRNPNYLAEQGIRVLASIDGRLREIDPASIDWWAPVGKALPFRFRQDAGDGNALGRVKMMFPNHEAIYLHDTPKRYLFRRTARAYSSGCIRVERPDDFAKMLVTAGAGWSEAQFESAYQSKATRAVSLEKGLPIHIVYLTSWVDEQGGTAFLDDVYERDELITQTIRARRAPAIPTADQNGVRTASIAR